ncbi:MAG: ABC transporter substrate-binding protein [Acidobacteriota bacterium]|nr:ABC transporter substrate-binding protein [Acidobacteriota bacterium]
MRIVSLQPSITVTLSGLGVGQDIVGCTRHCRELCPELASSAPQTLRDSWSADAAEILACKPDIVITSVPYRMEALAEILKTGTRVLALAPATLDDVYGDIRTLAAVADHSSSGELMISRLQEEISTTRARTCDVRRQRVYCEAWGKPLLTSPGWVSQLVEAAGGDLICPANTQVTSDQVLAADPEVILAAWCGNGNRTPLLEILERPGWMQTTAAREGRIYAVPDDWFNVPSLTLTLGLRAVRSTLHPRAFWRPSDVLDLHDLLPEEQQIG